MSEFDDVRTFTQEEEERLARNLYQVALELAHGRLPPIDFGQDLLCYLHQRIFGGVRGHAGRVRSEMVGTEFLTFGPNRSIHRSRVPAELARVFADATRSLRSFEENPDAPDYELSAIRTAVWTHAEIIEIHPFEDGNGRSCRLLLNWILRQLGMRTVRVEVPKQEYREALNHYFKTRDLQPLTDLFIRLLAAQL